MDKLIPALAYELVHRPNFKLTHFQNYLITDHFTWAEVFVNRTLREVEMASPIIFENALKQANLLESIRKLLSNELSQEIKIVLTSWWRSVESNQKVGGAPNSQHLLALATDFYVPGFESVMGNRQVQACLIPHLAALKCCLEITNGSWTHVDARKAGFAFLRNGAILTRLDQLYLIDAYGPKRP